MFYIACSLYAEHFLSCLEGNVQNDYCKLLSSNEPNKIVYIQKLANQSICNYQHFSWK